MRTKKIRFANKTRNKTVYVGIEPNEGRLEIHVYDEPGEDRDAISPMQRITIILPPCADDCIVNGNLLFTVVGHCAGPMLQLPTKASADGPLFTFLDSDA